MSETAAAARRVEAARADCLERFSLQFAAWQNGDDAAWKAMGDCLRKAARLEGAPAAAACKASAQTLARICRLLHRDRAGANPADRLPESRRRELLLFVVRESSAGDAARARSRLRAALLARLSAFKEHMVNSLAAPPPSPPFPVGASPARERTGHDRPVREQGSLPRQSSEADTRELNDAGLQIRRLAFLWRLWDGRGGGAALERMNGAGSNAHGAVPLLLRLEALLEEGEDPQASGQDGDWRCLAEQRASRLLAVAGTAQCRRIIALLLRRPVADEPDAVQQHFGRWERLLEAAGQDSLREELCAVWARLVHQLCRDGKCPRGIEDDLARIALAAEGAAPPPVSPPPAPWRAPPALPPVAAVLDREIMKYRRGLAVCGASLWRQKRGLASGRLLGLLYRLRLDLASLELAPWGGLADAAWRLFQEYWMRGQEVPPAAIAWLCRLPALLASCPGPPGRDARRECLQAQAQLLGLLWSLRRQGGKRVAMEAFDESSHVEPEQLPAVLARHFDLLLAVQDLSTRAGIDARMEPVLRELKVLERAAAALGIHRIEALAAALVEVYEELRCAPEEAVDFPANLLAEAHARLAAMLNQAAAWQEVKPAPGLVDRLYAWLEERQLRGQGEALLGVLRRRGALLQRGVAELAESLEDASVVDRQGRDIAAEVRRRCRQLGELLERQCLESTTGVEELHDAPLIAFARLVPGVRRYCARLCSSLDRQVHIAFGGAGTLCPRETLPEVLRALQEVLRHVLVQDGAAPELRRGAGRTALPNIRLDVKAGEGALEILVEDDIQRGNEAGLRRLREKVGRRLAGVEEAPGGSRYRLVFPPML